MATRGRAGVSPWILVESGDTGSLVSECTLVVCCCETGSAVSECELVCVYAHMLGLPWNSGRILRLRPVAVGVNLCM